MTTMGTSQDSRNIIFRGASYSIRYSHAFGQIRLEVPDSRELGFRLASIARMDADGKADITHRVGSPRVTRNRGITHLVFSQSSSLWKKRELIFLCSPDKLECYLRIQGRGTLDRLYFFTGLVDGQVIGSVPGFDFYCAANPNFLAKTRYAPNEYHSVSVGHDGTYWAPALASGALHYTFSRERGNKWLSCGLATEPGENRFDAFDFNFKSDEISRAQDNVVNTQSFSIAYNGHKRVDGEWESPRLVFQFASSQSACLKKYCRMLEERRLVPPRRRRQEPRWWRRPIFCGWHEQCALAIRSQVARGLPAVLSESQGAMSTCTQANHERWLRMIKRHRLPIGTLIIDAKWQTKLDNFEVNKRLFPDLRRFIDRCHSQDIKVLLWVQAWGLEGAAAGHCIKLNGKPVAPDPTHPIFRKQLEEGIHRSLSAEPGCLNADGLKIDGLSVCPAGVGLKTHGDIYGFELQRYYLELVYSAAKAAKSDALVSIFAANPYFHDVCDMVRLGDLYTVYGSPVETSRDRANVYQITMPDIPVDTDGWFRFSVDENPVAEFSEQVKFGIPCLYQIEQLYQHRPFVPASLRKFTNQDYRRMRTELTRYCSGLMPSARSRSQNRSTT